MKQRKPVTELRIPAEAMYVLVAKRAASALGSVAGFSLEGIDDLNIAVAQACEKAIAAGDRIWGPGNAQLKLTFGLVAGGIEMEVRSIRVAEEPALQPEALVAQRAARRARELAAAAVAAQPQAAFDLDEVAVNMIRLFVDELRYNVDPRGSVRMRMVKYHVG